MTPELPQLQADPVAVLRALPPEVMTPEEAAQYLNLTTATMLIWRKNGEGPKYCQVNSRTIRYLREDILAFMKEFRS